ncbi:MAG TPA: HAD-IB family phosphatase [Candidatus Saccharimonadales bacterium]|nr:HAD-IB family phosphatase [Candidatus Saccharimonadales bacterium]
MNKPTFIIDFDSTIIRGETLEELARMSLKDRPDRDEIMRQIQAITDQGMAGTLPFDESLQKRLNLFGAHRAILAPLIAQLAQDFSSSVLKHKIWFQNNRDRIYVLSGAFEEIVVPVVTQLGIAAGHVLANKFEYDDSGKIIGFDKTCLVGKAGGKVRQVESLKLPRPVIVIGDGFTDFEIRKAGAADEFWAFVENVNRPNVTDQADRVVKSFDEVVALTAKTLQLA